MKAPVGLLSDRTVLRSKMEGLCPDKFQFAALVPSRVWGTARPKKKLSHGAGNFQEWIICAHGTVLALYVFRKGLKERR